MVSLRPFRPLERQREHERSAWSDILSVFKDKVEHRWVFVLLSLAIPGALFLGFMVQYDREADYKPPDVVFMKSWKQGRTEAEIKAQQAIDAPAERAQKAAIKAAEDKRKAEFRKLADKMGIDVDK